MKSDRITTLDKRKNLSIDEIKERKKILIEKIEGIEGKYTQKATSIEGKVRKTLKPIHLIRQNPLKSLGASIAVGFLIGIVGRKKSTSTSSSPSSPGGSSGTGFTSLLISELKRMAAHRAMLYVSDIVDQKVMPKFISKPIDNKDEKQE